MDFNGLRLEFSLEGSSNYIAWKDRMEAVLEDNGLKEFIENDILKPNSGDGNFGNTTCTKEMETLPNGKTLQGKN